MRLLKEQLPERETHLGLRQVDVYAGLNVMIFLLELHRYASTKDELKDKITFHPCGKPNTKEFDETRLLGLIGYSKCLSMFVFSNFLTDFLRESDLRNAFLNGAIALRAMVRTKL